MTSWMSNQIANLYNAVSAPVVGTRDALAERLPSLRETTSLLYYRIMDDTEYGQERLKDTVKKETRQEEKEAEEQGEE